MTLNHLPSSNNTLNKIPIRNIWLLLLYASDLYRDINEQQRVKFEENPEKIIDLIAELYFKVVNDRFRKSLSNGYQSRIDTLTRVRGKIDNFGTARKFLLEKGQVQCSYNELTCNIPKNQYIHGAAHVLFNQLTDHNLRGECKKIINRFNRLKVGQLKNYNYKADYFDKYNRQDILLLSIAKLIFELSIPTEFVGNHSVNILNKSDEWLRFLFEKAIVGFCQIHFDHNNYSISSATQFKWQYTQSTNNIEKFMPNMKTDLIIENITTHNRLIIDTKCTSIFSKKSSSFKTSHLYQLYAYVRSQEQINDPLSLSSSGMLLYPTVNKSIYEHVIIQGHKLIFCTIDLTQDAQSIKTSLLTLFSDI